MPMVDSLETKNEFGREVNWTELISREKRYTLMHHNPTISFVVVFPKIIERRIMNLE
jgi:hypothetical protein